MAARFALGADDFRRVRRGGYRYVDKTDAITSLIDLGDQAVLLPRPRRFVKTINLSSLYYFFAISDEDRTDLFSGLHVWDAGEEYRRHFQRYPVIFLTFKDVKAASFDECVAGFQAAIAGAYREHRSRLEAAGLTPDDRQYVEDVLAKRLRGSDLAESLERLSEILAVATGRDVVILIDEYDTPVHAGFAHGYYDEVIEFVRNFLSGGLKGNQNLYKGVITGILRVAKESIFSGLNNVPVYSLLDERFATSFGFTEDEVAALAAEVDPPADLGELSDWYDGYRFGGHTVYNPWSVVSFLSDPIRRAKPYWVATSTDDLIRELLVERGTALHNELESLLGGGCTTKVVSDLTNLREVREDPDVIWSLLLFSGYLKAEEATYRDGDWHVRLRVPNREVAIAYRNLFRSELRRGLGGDAEVDALIRAVMSGDAAGLEQLLGTLVTRVLSFHDVAGAQPERVYHAFILGLLVRLEPDYEVRSNREAGHGRYDVMLRPRAPGRPGVVLELKALRRDAVPAVAAALDAALKQIRDKDYAAELRAAGAGPIHELAAVFDGKHVHVRSGDAPGAARAD